jgi:hypothetical protein
MKKRKTKFPDKQYIGFITGILVPMLAFFVYYKLKFANIEFTDYMISMHQYKLLFKIMSLCVLTDLVAFYLFMHFKLMRCAQGVVMACFLYALSVMGYRIFN